MNIEVLADEGRVRVRIHSEGERDLSVIVTDPLELIMEIAAVVRQTGGQIPRDDLIAAINDPTARERKSE